MGVHSFKYVAEDSCEAAAEHTGTTSSGARWWRSRRRASAMRSTRCACA